jgi:ketol-acid reductoisomerase
MAENREGGRTKFLATRKAQTDQPIEEVGAKLRSMMPFLKRKKEMPTA